MRFQKLSLGLALSMSFAANATTADFESRKQAMIKDIQAQSERTNLTTDGLVNIFAIAKAHGFVKTSDDACWTGEGGDQLGMLNFPSEDAKSMDVRRNMYWVTRLSQVFCAPEAIVREERYDHMIKGKENLCFELANDSTQTADMLLEKRDRNPVIPRERSEQLIVDYEANISIDKNNRVQVKLTGGGTYEQKVYLWNFDATHPSESHNDPRLKALRAEMDKARDNDDDKEENRLAQEIESFINGQPIAQIRSASNITTAQILKDFKGSGFFDPPLREENSAFAQSLAAKEGSKETQRVVSALIEQINAVKNSRRAEALAIEHAGLTKSKNELISEQQCKVEINDKSYNGQQPASCRYARTLADRRREAVFELSEVRRLEEERSQIFKNLAKIESEGLANIENDPSFLQLMLKLVQNDKKKN